MAKSAQERLDDQRIMRLFRYRCVVCMKPATEVNEIVLRSRTKEATTMPQNRVPMCHHCHTLYHWAGVNDEAQEKLRQYAIMRLSMFGVSVEEW